MKQNLAWVIALALSNMVSNLAQQELRLEPVKAEASQCEMSIDNAKKWKALVCPDESTPVAATTPGGIVIASHEGRCHPSGMVCGWDSECCSRSCGPDWTCR